MLDQSFSPDNFYKIFHLENRKGTFKRELLSEEYLAIHEKVKRLFADKFLMKKEEFDKQLDYLNDEKDFELRKYLQEVSYSCGVKSFAFQLSNFKKGGKTIYTIEKDAPSFFAMKQLQYNIFKTFKVKQSSRYDIIKQLRILLEDDFPKYLIRIDIKGFYENIPQGKLLEKIEGNQLLNFYSKKLLKRLIYDYESLKDPLEGIKEHGVPRGVGVSAYLSELYMRDIDNEMKSLTDLVYYARYVDDIVVVFIPRSKDKIGNYYGEIERIIKKHGLDLKDGSDGKVDKTVKANLFYSGIAREFDFLGYRFVLENSKLKELQLSSNKLKKYDDRLKAIVEDYNKNSKFNERIARKLLISRFKFLTGNFHLLNNKKRIKSGIYYSNILIRDNDINFVGFKDLDVLITKHLANLSPYSSLKVNIDKIKAKIIKRYSFQEGFYNRKKRFHSFDEDGLIRMGSVWNK